jgi:hypothetical protein
MIVFIVQVYDFNLCLADLERHAPVLGDVQRPRSFTVARKLMCFPARHGAQLVGGRHVLQKREHVVCIAATCCALAFMGAA